MAIEIPNDSLIYNFWFKEIPSELWFKKDEAFDNEIRKRFLNLHQQATRAELYSWRVSARGALSEIIILDQFSRNMFRGQPESFLYDTLALALAQFAIQNGFHKQLDTKEKAFLYMPFMHSESLAIHERAVELYSEKGLEFNLDYELKHKAIIERFGRYPHRNHILGRESTFEELEFLKTPGSSF
jgi:uncharacterized protein (DUF924 family)